VKNWDKSALIANNLPHVIEQLFEKFSERNIDYLLVGGIALLSYIDGRNTQDIDFIMSPNALLKLPELVISKESRDFARANFEELQIDILLTNNKLFNLVQKKYVSERVFGERVIRCVTVDGLILLKLYALPSLYRQGLFNKVSLYENDITQLLLKYTVEIKPLLKILKSHVIDTDLIAIQETIADIQERIKRLKQRQNRLQESQDT
jgi:hypothetical protein